MRDRGAERTLQQVGHAAHQLRKVDRLLLQVLAPREGEHALGQRRAALRALHGVVEQRHQLGIVRQPLAHQLEAAEHRHQQIVEVVRDAAGELADRIHLLRLEQRLAGLLEPLLRLAALGDVARDLGEADDLAAIVADGIDDDMRPEAAAVLAHAPAFLLEAALAPGGVERLLRLAVAAVLLGVELREVAADDLVRQVALDPLRAGIPVGHAAFGVEHVDRVVGDALHQQAELLLALPQRLLGRAPLGQVAGDLGEADDLAGGRADRVDDHIGPEAGAVLADAPAFRFELAFARGRCQRACRDARRAIFFGDRSGRNAVR